MTQTAIFAQHLEDIGRKPPSSQDIDSLQSLLLDHIGVVANGSTTDTALALSDYVAHVDGPSNGSIPLIGTTASAAPLTAALFNGVAGHSIEFDDVHNASSTHPGVVVFPAAMAATGLCDAPPTTERFILGCLAGYEAMCRVGRALSPAEHYRQHFHPTATTGRFGAAVAAGVILELSPDELNSAIGIAATTAAGSMQFLVDGAWTKRLHPGQAAKAGLEAALLAKYGIRGTSDGICGERGFLTAYSANPSPHELFEGWGTRPLEIHETSIKAHTCCRYMQGPIDALLDIKNINQIESSLVKRIRVGIPSVATDIIWEPVKHKRRPLSVVDAQFSMPFGAAVAMRFGRASLSEFTPSILEMEDVMDLMQLTECIIDEDLDTYYPEEWRSWAEIETSNGDIFYSYIKDPKGDPTNPLSQEELENKFLSLTEHIYTASHQKQILSAVSNLTDTFNLPDFLNLLLLDTA